MRAKANTSGVHGRRWAAVACAALLLAGAAGCSDDDGGGGNGKSPKGSGKSSGKGGGRSAGASAAPADNGVAKLPAQDISEKAQQELLHTTAVRVTVADRSSKPAAGSPSAMDLALDHDDNCKATLTFGDDGKADIVRRGQRVWMRMDDSLWQAQVPGAEGRAAAELFRNRYVSGPITNPTLKELGSVCDLKALQDQLRKETRSDEVTRKSGRATVDGTPAVRLTGKDGDVTKTLYVATRGKPYALKYTEVSSGAAGDRKTDTTTTYSDYGKPVSVRTPSAGESVDISKLGSLQ